MQIYLCMQEWEVHEMFEVSIRSFAFGGMPNGDDNDENVQVEEIQKDQKDELETNL